MSKLPALTPKEVLKALLRANFYIYHQKGSHAQLRHPIKIHLRVTIPIHTNYDLAPRVIASILKQTQLSRDEFIGLL